MILKMLQKLTLKPDIIPTPTASFILKNIRPRSGSSIRHIHFSVALIKHWVDRLFPSILLLGYPGLATLNRGSETKCEGYTAGIEEQALVVTGRCKFIFLRWK